jgi:hypothetical protein
MTSMAAFVDERLSIRRWSVNRTAFEPTTTALQPSYDSYDQTFETG